MRRVVGMKMSMEDRRMKGKFNGYFDDSGYQQWMKAKVTTVGPDDSNVPFFQQAIKYYRCHGQRHPNFDKTETEREDKQTQDADYGIVGPCPPLGSQLNSDLTN